MDFTIGSALHYSSSRNGCLSLLDYNIKRTEIEEEDEDDEIQSFSTLLYHLQPIPTFSIEEIKKKEQKIEKNITCSQPKCKRIGNINCSIKSCKKCCIGLHKKSELLSEGKDISKMYLNVCNLEEANNIISIENLSKDYCKYHKVGNEIAFKEREEREREEMKMNEEKNRIEYKSEAKVLIDGLGADELFYGYLRHRMKYEKEGIESMKKEVELDINRLWKRNLGRDDRCMSDNGVEIRFPYLDENVIQFSKSIPIEEIVDMNLPKGYGDKMILRKIGVMLGLNGVFNLEKRAIQFGSRIAKETSFNEFGKSCRNISGDVTIEMDEENDDNSE